MSALPSGESSPEPWTPPHAVENGNSRSRTVSGNGLGMVGEQTPEAWPELAPSFRLDPEQPPSCHDSQGPAMVRATGPTMVNTVPCMMPMPGMWPAPIAYPFGMVFDGNVLNPAHMHPPGGAVTAPARKNRTIGQP